MVIIFLAFISAAFAENKVLIVDSGVATPREYLCQTGHVDTTHTGFTDRIDHGSVVADIIGTGLKNACIVVFKFTDTKNNISSQNVEDVNNQLMDVIKKERPMLINMSLSGEGYSPNEARMIEYALTNTDAEIVVAAGNDKKKLTCDIFPACHMPLHPRFHIAGTNISNTGTNVTVVSPKNETEKELLKHGSSFAAAILSRRILERKLK